MIIKLGDVQNTHYKELSTNLNQSIANVYAMVEHSLVEAYAKNVSYESIRPKVTSVVANFGSTLGAISAIGNLTSAMTGDDPTQMEPSITELLAEFQLGYLNTAVKSAKSLSDNPIVFTAHPSNYHSIRKGIFANRDDALESAELFRKLNVKDFELQQSVMGSLQEQLGPVFTQIGGSFTTMEHITKRYEFDLRAINVMYK